MTASASSSADSSAGSFFARLVSRLFGSSVKETGASSMAALEAADLDAEWLVVGLGNPGAKYAATRHNVGYMAVDDLLAESGELLQPVAGHSLTAAPLNVADTPVLVVRSATFMNLSGDPIAPLAQQLGIPAERILVIHDELDLPPNKIRIKVGGNENGHNGLKSLTERLGTRDYPRVRIGIGRPPKGSSIPDYVLGPVDADAGFDAAIETAADAVRLIVSSGIQSAQNEIHSRK
ncbi:aminoacyl-tRNA hydrolase [Corynebacterium striatum]|uniref:aminoacyl-tRNA hydrolase n=1 Tax=Corynebacterium striatum TaxID=43770 RepID=UPI003B5B802D